MRSVATALLVWVLGFATARAESLIVPVVGQGWQITYDGPVLAMQTTDPNRQGLVFRGNAGRFNVSTSVENPSGNGGDSKACRDLLWAKASQNPMIQKDSVKQWSAPACECVEYLVAGADRGGKFTQANINCFFAHAGKWVDVHASVMSPKDDDIQMLKQLGQSLAYGAFPEWKGGRHEVVLGDLGLLQIELPAGWRVGNLSVTQMTGMPTQQTLSFYSATDPNKKWLMSFFKTAVRYKTQEDIRKVAQNSQQSAVSRSVENAINLQEIKLKQGVGCQSVYTEAALVGKAVELGNPKVISSGMIAPQPNILGTISIFADDAKDPHFQEAIKALDTLVLVPVKKA